MSLTFSLIHFVNKDGEKGGGKLFGLLLSADISRVNVWYSAGIPTFLRKLGSKEGKERKNQAFSTITVLRVYFSVSLMRMRRRQYFIGPRWKLFHSHNS